MKVDIASLTGEKHAMHVQLLPKYLQKDADGHTRLSANLKSLFFVKLSFLQSAFLQVYNYC